MRDIMLDAPDWDDYEAEQERKHKLLKRRAAAEEAAEREYEDEVIRD